MAEAINVIVRKHATITHSWQLYLASKLYWYRLKYTSIITIKHLGSVNSAINEFVCAKTTRIIVDIIIWLTIALRTNRWLNFRRKNLNIIAIAG